MGRHVANGFNSEVIQGDFKFYNRAFSDSEVWKEFNNKTIVTKVINGQKFRLI